MSLIIKTDTLTPKLKRVRKRLPKTVAREVKRMLMYGKKQAQKYATGDTQTKQLRKAIMYRVYKNRGKGELISYATGYSSGFPYNLWVNRNIPILAKYPFFANNQGYIYYGKSGVRTPSGRNVTWRVTPGFFDRAWIDMRKRFPSTMKRIMKGVIR